MLGLSRTVSQPFHADDVAHRSIGEAYQWGDLVAAQPLIEQRL